MVMDSPSEFSGALAPGNERGYIDVREFFTVLSIAGCLSLGTVFAQ